MKHTKTKLLSLILAAVMVLAVIPFAVFADTVDKQDSGNEENQQGTTVYTAAIGEQKYTTLAEAFAAAKKGDTVELLADITLTSGIVIDNTDVLSDITFEGNGHKITLDIAVTDTGISFGKGNKYMTNGVKVQNVTVETAEGTDARFGIYLNGGNYAELKNVTVLGKYHEQGVSFYGTCGGTVTNCTLVSVWSNGKAYWEDSNGEHWNKISLVSTKVGRFVVNDDSSTTNYKLTADANSCIDELIINGSDNSKIDPEILNNTNIVKSYKEYADKDWSTAVAITDEVYYQTLQEAFDAAVEGSIVKIRKDVDVDASIKVWDRQDYLNDITVYGDNHTLTKTKNDNTSVFIFGWGSCVANGVKIRDITIKTAEGVTGQYAIYLHAGKLAELTNVTIEGDWEYGINFYGSNGGTMTNCNIKAKVWVNGDHNKPLTLVNTHIDYLSANSMLPDGKAKVFADENSTITTLRTYGRNTIMIDPAIFENDIVGELIMTEVLMPDKADDTSRVYNDKTAVAALDGVYYYSVQDALDDAKGDTHEPRTVKLVTDIESDNAIEGYLLIDGGAKLDLDGYTLTCNKSVIVLDGAIIDTAGIMQGKLVVKGNLTYKETWLFEDENEDEYCYMPISVEDEGVEGYRFAKIYQQIKSIDESDEIVLNNGVLEFEFRPTIDRIENVSTGVNNQYFKDGMADRDMYISVIVAWVDADGQTNTFSMMVDDDVIANAYEAGTYIRVSLSGIPTDMTILSVSVTVASNTGIMFDTGVYAYSNAPESEALN